VLEGSLRVFGRRAFPLHLLAVLLHGAIAFLFYIALRRLGAGEFLALLAAVFWVACEDHSMTVGFISFVTDPLAVLLLVLALLGHLSWLRDRRLMGLLGSLGALVLALGCKETAAVGPLILVATTLAFPGGTLASGVAVASEGLRGRWDALRRDPLSWVPQLAVLVAFVGLYKALDLGGMDNLAYRDPTAHPLWYAGHLVVHLPVMWLATLTVVPPGLGFLTPEAFVPMAVGGAVMLPLFLWALGGRMREPLVQWAAALYLLSLLPQLGTEAGERLLYLPYLFASVVLARVVLEIGPLRRRLPSSVEGPSRGGHDPAAPDREVRLRTRLCGWYLAGGVLLFGAGLSVAVPFTNMSWARRSLEAARSAVTLLSPDTERVVVVSTRDFFELLMLPTILKEGTGRPVEVRTLSAHWGRMTLERTGEASLVLRTDRKGWLGSFMARIFRRSSVLEEGRTYGGDLFDATILELTEDGEDVGAARFRWHGPLEPPGTRYLFWNGRGYELLSVESLGVGEPKVLNPSR
jgi:hypothetical protein